MTAIFGEGDETDRYLDAHAAITAERIYGARNRERELERLRRSFRATLANRERILKMRIDEEGIVAYIHNQRFLEELWDKANWLDLPEEIRAELVKADLCL